MRKPTMWFSNRSDTNRAVQAQKIARCGKFWIYEEDDLYYPFSENKGADQLRGYCVFVFAYANCWFSHNAAHYTALGCFLRNSTARINVRPKYP